jgi:ABC-type uncharacterized transport system substrate-binding protein
VLKYFGHASDMLAPFAQRLMGVVEPKFNRQLYDGRLEGYGLVINLKAAKTLRLRIPESILLRADEVIR